MTESASATILPGPGVKMDAEMQPAFRTKLTHGPSGTAFNTEAPKDNGGNGTSFSPTDLLAASLMSCAMTTMQLAAQREGIPFGSATAHIEKRMTPAPRRVGQLHLSFEMPAGLSPAHRARLEEIAHGCPVARSLHPDVHAPMVFRYPDDPK